MKENNEKNIRKSASFVPFEEQYELEQLKLFMIVVNSGQGNAIVKYLFDLGVAAAFATNGEGTATNTSDIFNVTGSRKQVVWALVPVSKVDSLKKKLHDRFKLSFASQGMALSIDVSTIVGVTLYKFLTGMDMGGLKDGK